jgi:hypothetical protein
VLRSLNVSPRTRANYRWGQKAVPLNSWERGIATEPRPGGTVMPYLSETGSLVGVKDFAETRNTGCWDHPGKQVSSA